MDDLRGWDQPIDTSQPLVGERQRVTQNIAERVLRRMASERGPVFPKTLQRDLGLSRSSVRRGLYALLILEFAERGARHPKSRVRPLKVYLPRDEHGTVTKRGVGFAAEFNGEIVGPSRRTYAEARKDLRLHRFENAAPSVREAVSPTESAEA